jgi:hypothetical protein
MRVPIPRSARIDAEDFKHRSIPPPAASSILTNPFGRDARRQARLRHTTENTNWQKGFAMKRSLTIFVLAVLVGPIAVAQNGPAARDVQQVLADAATAQQYTFILFYRDNGAATQTMLTTLKQELASRNGDTTITYVDVQKRGQKPIVEKFGVGRAPMPLTIAVAPNGAVTGVFARKISASQVAGAFATPRMAQCMKSMQEGRMVFVCVSATPGTGVPAGVQAFRADPEFSGRADVVSFPVNDPAETDFLQQLKIDPQSMHGSITAFLAPPAVLVGKFNASTTKGEIAAALHAAGKCCDDPNCKHNHGGPQANQSNSARRK